MADTTAPSPLWRREARAFAEIFALCGFALTQPLLDLFGRGAEQFALRGASAAQIVGFGLAVTFLPALGIWLSGALVGCANQRLRRGVHAGALAVLVAAFVVQAVRSLVSGPGLVLVAAVIGGGAAVAHRRFAVVRIWLGFAAIAPIGFLLLFLFTSRTSELLTDDATTSDIEVGAPAPVVMVLLDELPLASLLTVEGTIDDELFPNLARLANGSHWFRNTTAVTSTTWHAVPTILTGQVPTNGDGPFFGSNPESLFTLLGGQYDLRVTETISRMCPSELCSPTGSGPSVWRGLTTDALRVMRSRLSPTTAADDPVAGFVDGSGADGAEEEGFPDLGISQPDRFRALIDGLDPDVLALHYLHLLLPHVPYRHLPSGTVYDGPVPDLGRIVELDQWGDETWPVLLGRQRHLLQLGYVDQLVGILLDELEATGLYDDALVVLTADHGISFEAGGPIRALEGQALDEQSAPDILWVPMFVKLPGQTEGVVSDANVQAIDILPTIADVLDVEIPFPTDGRSAFGPPRSTTTKPYYGNDVNGFGVEVHDPVDVDGPSGFAAVLERSVGHFLPATGDPRRLWRVGPSPQLVGRRAADVRDQVEPIDVGLRTPEAYEDVPASGTKPVLVRGRLPDRAAAGTPVAVAVNGVIAATAPAYREEGAVVFAVMVDEALLRPGSNEVRVYELR